MNIDFLLVCGVTFSTVCLLLYDHLALLISYDGSVPILSSIRMFLMATEARKLILPPTSETWRVFLIFCVGNKTTSQGCEVRPTCSSMQPGAGSQATSWWVAHGSDSVKASVSLMYQQNCGRVHSAKENCRAFALQCKTKEFSLSLSSWSLRQHRVYASMPNNTSVFQQPPERCVSGG